MKRAGIAIIIVGLLFTIITGFKYFTREKVLDIGSIKITASEPHRVNWSPALGVGIMVVGGALVLFGKK
jgi:hypothetical protein